jgi:pimeloyl-ACP methyl ester carboxylesterase
MTKANVQKDLRNHGSSPHAFPHTYDSLAADVLHFIKTHKLELPTLIGHSMGAKTVMTLALEHPEMFESVIPVDNAPVDAALKSDFHSYVQGMKEVERLDPSKQSEADDILKPYAKELPVRQFLLTNLVRPKDGSRNFVWRIPLAGLAKTLDSMGDFAFNDPDKVRFEKPALFVRGTKSPYVPDEALPIIGRFFPRFKVADIDSGHWVISEKPDEFRRVVVEFMSDLDST